MREIRELDVLSFSRLINVSTEKIIEYEKGRIEIPWSFIYNAARILRVDIVDLCIGETPRLKKSSVTRSTKGLVVDKDTVLLSHNLQNRYADIFLLTVYPEEAKFFSHNGQIIIMVLSGKIGVKIDDGIEEILDSQDNYQFNSIVSHTIHALDGQVAKCKVIIFK
jgi:hypothetical protein